MSRRHRRLVAWFGIAGIVFAQIATAHAWIDRVHAFGPSVAPPHQSHCGGGSAPPASQGNACKLQCSEAAPSGATPDLPSGDVAWAPIVVAPAALPAETRAHGRSFLAADIAAPPLSLLFCRLLN
jgi:hypothetical protein